MLTNNNHNTRFAIEFNFAYAILNLLHNQLELPYSLRKEIGAGPLGPPLRKIFIVYPRNFF